MRLPQDILSGVATKPQMYLCNPNKEILGGIKLINASGVFKFNSFSEISGEVDRVYTDLLTGQECINPLYDYIEALRLIYVVNYGYFQIQEASITYDGVREYKDVVAYSLEYELTQKYLDNFVINMGSVESIDGCKILNQADISHSLLHLALNKMNGSWQVGHVDMSIQDLQRSFEINHQSIYDFLINDLAPTINAVVEFDTYDKVVNIYDEDNYGKNTNIYISMDTIANETHVDYSADDIKTTLYVYGDNNISIREANLGLEYLTDLSYYQTPEWMGQDLYEAYTQYCILTESYRETYSNLMLQWSALYDRYSALYNKIPDYEEDYNDDIPTVYSKSELPTPSEKNVYMQYRVVEGDATWYYICRANSIDDITIYQWVLDVDNISSFYTFPPPSIEYVGSVYKVYNSDSTDGVLYYICESYQKDDRTTAYRWVIAESGYGINLLKEKESCYLDIQEVQVSAGYAEKTSDQYDRYLENYEKLIEIQTLLKQEEAKAAELKTQLDGVMSQMNDISKEIALENNFTIAQIVKLNSFIREDQYTDSHFLITALDDDASALEVKKELMAAAQKELRKISQPQLSFSMTMANILAMPEFEPVMNDFECGNFVIVEIRSGYVVKTQILEVDLNFDDLSDFSVTFGNLSSLYSQTDIHAELLSQAISAGKSVAESSAYWDRGANTAYSINSRIEAGLIDSNTTIKSTENQAISWDTHGLHLRKYANEEKTEYEDDQIWMNNEKIVFTDDNWRTAKMAIGKVFDSNLITDLNPLGEAYGIIAPNIIGTLLAGENLVIDSAKSDGTLSSFRVDHNGARLYNSTFLMEKKVTGADGTVSNGQIIIDPLYGIVAGNDIYTTKSDGTIVPAFDENKQGVVNKHEGMPINSQFFLDINNGNAYFHGTVYADGGYFSGSLNGANITGAVGTFSGTIKAGDGDIGGWIIDEGCLYSDLGENPETKQKRFVALSSKYDSKDISTNYAIWAGAIEGKDAPFSVDREGNLVANNARVTGHIEATSGKFTGELVAATGEFEGHVVATSGTIGGCDIVGDHLSVPAAYITDLTIDALGSISFGDLTDHQTVQDDIDSKASESDVQALADGKSTGITGTFINGTTIQSPVIKGNEVNVLGGYFRVRDNADTKDYGYIGYAKGLDGSKDLDPDERQTDGVALSWGSPVNLLDSGSYVIVTDRGVRLQHGSSKLYVVDGGCYVSHAGSDPVLIGTGTGTCVFG